MIVGLLLVSLTKLILITLTFSKFSGIYDLIELKLTLFILILVVTILGFLD